MKDSSNSSLSTELATLPAGTFNIEDDHLYVEVIDDGEAEILEPAWKYEIDDLVKYWCNEGLQLEDQDEQLFYEHEMYWLEYSLFIDMLGEGMHSAIVDASGILNAHPNKLLVHMVFLERIISRRNELLGAKENAGQPYPVGRKAAIARLECLIDYVRTSLHQISLSNNREKLHWTGNFSHFVELLDALLMTGNLNGLKSVDAFVRCQELIEFDNPKSPKIFEVTMHKNRLRIDNTRFIEELLVKYKGVLTKKLEAKTN